MPRWSASLSEGPDPVPRPIDHLLESGEDAAPALVLRSGTFNRGAVRERIGRMAGWLRTLGLAPGARVASWAAKGELTCLLPLAAARAGLVHVPINPLLKRSQVAHILADSGATLLLGTKARLDTLQAGDVPVECAMIGEDEALAGVSSCDVELPASDAAPDDLAALLYTSGSTGRPKGVMLSHANLWLGAVSVAHYLGLKPDDVVLAVLPLSFDYGQNQLLSAWVAGASVVPLDFLTPRDVIKACARHGVTTLAAVPPLWVQLVEQEWPEEAIASLMRLTNSGGALGEQLVRKLRAIFPQARLFPMYGLTEAFRSTYLKPALVDAHPTSIGRAVPFAEVLVMRDEATLARPGEEGELVHCGPLVAQGYWRDPVRTAERFRPAPPQSHYGGMAVWSGDRVVRDEEGLLHFVGRRDAMIKSAGNRISPQDIEEAALATGLVKEAVALGVPDERFGQAVLLVVRGSAQDEEALRAALKRELPNFMQPQAIRWVAAMPLGPNGKVDREALLREGAPA
jgi:acyl-CoA ligase (AMP-forming) (exosortase A-associated)